MASFRDWVLAEHLACYFSQAILMYSFRECQIFPFVAASGMCFSCLLSTFLAIHTNQIVDALKAAHHFSKGSKSRGSPIRACVTVIEMRWEPPFSMRPTCTVTNPKFCEPSCSPIRHGLHLQAVYSWRIISLHQNLATLPNAICLKQRPCKGFVTRVCCVCKNGNSAKCL